LAGHRHREARAQVQARTSVGEHHHSPCACAVCVALVRLVRLVRLVLTPATLDARAARTVAEPRGAATGILGRSLEGVGTSVAVAEAGMNEAVVGVGWTDVAVLLAVRVGETRCRFAAAVAGAAEEDSPRS